MSRQLWSEPGVYPVADGVHRMPLPLPMDGLRAVNVYVIETESGLTLIDGGWAIAESRRLFRRGIESLGYRLGDIRSFLVTHMHRDHYTQARVIGSEVGAPVSLGLGERPTMELLRSDAPAPSTDSRIRSTGAEHLAEAWRAMTTGSPVPADQYAMPDVWLQDGARLVVGDRTLDAMSTPGHTQGHFVFADQAAGLLFAGDHVLPRITPSIGFEPAYVQQPLRDYLDSLVKVRSMPDLTLLPAHGAVTDSTHARVDALLEHHDERLGLSHAAVLAGASSAWEVALRLPWTRRKRRAEDLGAFDAALAAFETLAHLELLALRGDLSRRESDGVIRFAAVSAR